MSDDKGQNRRVGAGMTYFLIFFPLIMMIAIGSLNNNLSNSSISGNPTLTCDQTLGNCYNTVSVGCQATPSACTLNGGTVSFLSQTSPFTQLLTGNIFGVFNQITTGSAAIGHGPFDSVGSNNYILGNCIVDDSGGVLPWHLHFDACTEANSDASNMTKANANTWTNWNSQWVSKSKATPFYQIVSNGTVTVTCQWDFMINYTFSGSPYDGWSWYGCHWGNPTPSFPSSEKTQLDWSFMIAVQFSQASLNPVNGYGCGYAIAPHKCYHIEYPVQLEGWETQRCPFLVTGSGGTGQGRQTTPWDISPQCDQFNSNLVSQTKQSGNGIGSWGPLITFLVGIALFFLGTGIGIQGGGTVLASGGTFGLFSNPQGTKMAQILGGGLIVWSVIYSEFGSWIVPTYLPYGTDIIMFFLLSGAFFFGLYERF